MKKIYVLQHVPSEPLGIWEEELHRWHAPFTCLKLWEGEPLPEPKAALGAIVMGGPMNVEEQDRFPHLKAEIEFIRALVALETPVLGVCLGGQLLAAALGARVGYGPEPEIGYAQVTLTPVGAEDTLFTGFPMTLPVFQWHAQGFELPKGAVLLAASPGYPHQAFRFGKAWGLQFHLEVTPEMVLEWARDGERDLQKAGLTPALLSEQIHEQAQMVSLYGRQVIRRFWDAIADI
jgi:GMP synthase-like glutamine amidotransferase